MTENWKRILGSIFGAIVVGSLVWLFHTVLVLMPQAVEHEQRLRVLERGGERFSRDDARELRHDLEAQIERVANRCGCP